MRSRTLAVSVPGVDADLPGPVNLPPHDSHHGAPKPLAFSWAGGPPPSGGERKTAISFGIHHLHAMPLDAHCDETLPEVADRCSTLDDDVAWRQDGCVVRVQGRHG